MPIKFIEFNFFLYFDKFKKYGHIARATHPITCVCVKITDLKHICVFKNNVQQNVWFEIN